MSGPTLPASARLPINRCNVPPVILGSLSFQRQPTPLRIDGVAEFHRDLFAMLAPLAAPAVRAQRFMDYMVVHFCLEHLEEAGLSARPGKRARKADYLKILRGWLFDPDGREAAVLKGWVESRFGLLPRHHKGPLGDFSGDTYQAYLAARAQGLYNTNALEAQLDLLFSYCQYELARVRPNETHTLLYRGLNHLDGCEILERCTTDRSVILLLNNLNSFTTERERADEFGDYILTARVPLAKVFCFSELLPGRLRGEGEVIVIGGVYEARVSLL